jgi:hypothetical protein
MPLMRTRSCTRLLDHGRPCLLWWRLVFQMGAPAIRDYELTHSSIKITCAPAKNVLEGILFTACPLTHAIAINTTPAPPNPSAPVFSQPGDYHIIPFAHIESFEIVGSGERASEATAGFESGRCRAPSPGRADNPRDEEEGCAEGQGCEPGSPGIIRCYIADVSNHNGSFGQANISASVYPPAGQTPRSSSATPL